MSAKFESKKSVRVFGAMLLVLSVLAVGSSAFASTPAQPGDAGLFTDAPRPEGDYAHFSESGTTRTRYAKVKLEHLGDPSAPARFVELNLFEDSTYTAVFDRTETNSLGSYAWIGHLKGVKHGQAVLVMTHGLLAGNISMPGATFEVRPISGGLHAIEQTNQQDYPPEMEPIPAGEPARAMASPSQVLADECDEITVLVAYSPEARNADGGIPNILTRVALAVAETNQSYVNSGLTQRINLVHSMETSAGDAQNDFSDDLYALQDLSDGVFDDVDAARETHDADLVALIIETSGSCGLGFLNSTEAWAFSVTHRTCATGNYSFGHELGHNMGARHDWYVDDANNYHKGFVWVDADWRTIMSYNRLCDDEGTYCTRLQYWSNPDVNYGGDPMGVISTGPTNCVEDSTTPDPSTCAADNRLRLNNTCDTVANFRVSNQPPVVTVDQDPVEVDEGQTATNSGTVSDPDGDPVTLTASVGTIVNNGDGTWSWSWPTTDGPDDSQTVSITATDDDAESTTETFDLTVNNVPPSVGVDTDPVVVDEGYVATNSGTYSDPGNDTVSLSASAGTVVDNGNGTWDWSLQTYDGPDDSQTVSITATDSDGDWTTVSFELTVNNVDPAVAVSVPSDPVQYSDYICPVTFTAFDVAADTLTAATTPSSLWGSLSLVFQECVVSGDSIWQTCTWTLEGTMDEPVGDYLTTVTVSDEDGGSGSADTTVTVLHEDADIWLEPTNPVAVEVDAPGGDSPLFSLTAYVQETTPDEAACGADPGDISNADVSISLVPVGPGGTVTEVCLQAGVTGTGYDAVLEVRCDFDDVPVNVYHVQATVIGDYYVSGIAEEVLVVFDPSLGFTTGGGWFYWPGTTEKTSFGYVMKYNKKMSNVKGSLLIIRHVDEDVIYRVKSNALRGLSIGEFTDGGSGEIVGWASFAGKCTYIEPGWPEPIGNHRFVVYVEDWDEPGAGIDQFWLEVTDKQLVPTGDMSMPRPGFGNTTTLGGGNIVVPHTPN